MAQDEVLGARNGVLIELVACIRVLVGVKGSRQGVGNGCWRKGAAGGSKRVTAVEMLVRVLKRGAGVWRRVAGGQNA